MNILAQGSEIADAAKGWGDQLPALGLGLVAMLVLALLFLWALRFVLERHEAERGARAAAHKDEREARDKAFLDSLKDLHEKYGTTAAQCHASQAAATGVTQECIRMLGKVEQTLEEVSRESRSTRELIHSRVR